jgi:hypothetical protein
MIRQESIASANIITANVRTTFQYIDKLLSEAEEFLSLYANRLRRWMDQSINALRDAFTEFADMHRAHFEVAPHLVCPTYR